MSPAVAGTTIKLTASSRRPNKQQPLTNTTNTASHWHLPSTLTHVINKYIPTVQYHTVDTVPCNTNLIQLIQLNQNDAMNQSVPSILSRQGRLKTRLDVSTVDTTQLQSTIQFNNIIGTGTTINNNVVVQQHTPGTSEPVLHIKLYKTDPLEPNKHIRHPCIRCHIVHNGKDKSGELIVSTQLHQRSIYQSTTGIVNTGDYSADFNNDIITCNLITQSLLQPSDDASANHSQSYLLLIELLDFLPHTASQSMDGYTHLAYTFVNLSPDTIQHYINDPVTRLQFYQLNNQYQSITATNQLYEVYGQQSYNRQQYIYNSTLYCKLDMLLPNQSVEQPKLDYHAIVAYHQTQGEINKLINNQHSTKTPPPADYMLLPPQSLINTQLLSRQQVDAHIPNILSYRIQSNYICCTSYAHHDSLLAVAYCIDTQQSYYTVHVVNSRNGEATHIFTSSNARHYASINSIQWNHDGTQFITTSNDNTMKLWKLPVVYGTRSTRCSVHTIDMNYTMNTAQYMNNPHNSIVVCGGNNNIISFYNCITPYSSNPVPPVVLDQLQIILPVSDIYISSMCMNHSGTLLFIGCNTNKLYIYHSAHHNNDIQPYKYLDCVELLYSDISHIQHITAPERICILYKNGIFTVYSYRSTAEHIMGDIQCRYTILSDPNTTLQLYKFALSGDQRYAILPSGNGLIKYVNLKSGHIVHTELVYKQSIITCVQWQKYTNNVCCSSIKSVGNEAGIVVYDYR